MPEPRAQPLLRRAAHMSLTPRHSDRKKCFEKCVRAAALRQTLWCWWWYRRNHQRQHVLIQMRWRHGAEQTDGSAYQKNSAPGSDPSAPNKFTVGKGGVWGREGRGRTRGREIADVLVCVLFVWPCPFVSCAAYVEGRCAWSLSQLPLRTQDSLP